MIRSKGSFGATAWADAGIVCPYTIWKVYGDTTVIRDHYAAMAKYIDYLHKTSKDLIRGQGAYGDWLNLGGGAKSEVIGTAYFEHVTRLMSEMAGAIDKPDDAAKYRRSPTTSATRSSKRSSPTMVRSKRAARRATHWHSRST